MKTIRCSFGVHNYEPDYESREVRCGRCGKVNTFATSLRLAFEKKMLDRVESGMYDVEFANRQIKDYWEVND